MDSPRIVNTIWCLPVANFIGYVQSSGQKRISIYFVKYLTKMKCLSEKGLHHSQQLELYVKQIKNRYIKGRS
jgi:hypothetical protein